MAVSQRTYCLQGATVVTDATAGDVFTDHFLPPLPGAKHPPAQPAPPVFPPPPPGSRAPRRGVPSYAMRRRLGTVSRVCPVPPPPPTGPAPKRSKALKRGIDALHTTAEAEQAEEGLRNLVAGNEAARRRRLVLEQLRLEAMVHQRLRAKAAEDVARRVLAAAEAGERGSKAVAFAAEAPGVVLRETRRRVGELQSDEARGRVAVAAAMAEGRRAVAVQAATAHLSTLPKREHRSRIAIVGQEWCGAAAFVAMFALGVDEAAARVALRDLKEDDSAAEMLRRRERLFAERLELADRDRTEAQGWRQLLKLGEVERKARAEAHERDLPTHESVKRVVVVRDEAAARLLVHGRAAESALLAVIQEMQHDVIRDERRLRAAIEAEAAAPRGGMRLDFTRGYTAVMQLLEGWAPARDRLAAVERDRAEGIAVVERAGRAELAAVGARLRGMEGEQKDGVQHLADSERLARRGVEIDEGSTAGMHRRSAATSAVVAGLRARQRETADAEPPARQRLLSAEAAELSALVASTISLPLVEDEELSARAHLHLLAESSWEATAGRAAQGLRWIGGVAEQSAKLVQAEADSRSQLQSWQATRHDQQRDRWRLIAELRETRAAEHRTGQRSAMADYETGARRLVAQAEAAERGDSLGAAVWQGEWMDRRLIMQDEFDARMDGNMWSLECAEVWVRWVLEAYEVLHRWWHVLTAAESAADAARASVQKQEQWHRNALTRQLQRRLMLADCSAQLRDEALRMALSDLEASLEPDGRAAAAATEEAARASVARLQSRYRDAIEGRLRESAAAVLRPPVLTLITYEEEYGRVGVAAAEQKHRHRLAASAPRPPVSDTAASMELTAGFGLTLERGRLTPAMRAVLWRDGQFVLTVAAATYDPAGRALLLADAASGAATVALSEQPGQRLRWILERGGVELRLVAEEGAAGDAEEAEEAEPEPEPAQPRTPGFSPPSPPAAHVPPATPEHVAAAATPTSRASSDAPWIPRLGASPLPFEALLLEEAVAACACVSPLSAPVGAKYVRGLLGREAGGREAVAVQQLRARSILGALEWQELRAIMARAAAWQAITMMPADQRRRLCDRLADGAI
eukprot:TRINITY_DN3834_c0_g1_i1.p1 TRINITY_DN3834_c0_g1~~TRINITY_DN3834_c0_g1_i1.p1  ORF type:complete len:1095 (+),score=460.15 TRINITY_DN3834_c0_g1_i1:52-3336(+)